LKEYRVAGKGGRELSELMDDEISGAVYSLELSNAQRDLLRLKLDLHENLSYEVEEPSGVAPKPGSAKNDGGPRVDTTTHPVTDARPRDPGALQISNWEDVTMRFPNGDTVALHFSDGTHRNYSLKELGLVDGRSKGDFLVSVLGNLLKDFAKNGGKLNHKIATDVENGDRRTLQSRVGQLEKKLQKGTRIGGKAIRWVEDHGYYQTVFSVESEGDEWPR
jgi:hypothetical protein